MRIKQMVDEDFVNYKVPAIYIGTSVCTFKCGSELCQNYSLAGSKVLDIPASRLVERYMGNPITHAAVIAGLEPFDTFDDLMEFVGEFRKQTSDDVVVYTGYTEDEIEGYLGKLKQFPNITVKFGRYIPGNKPHFDGVLGVNLASDNQYAKKIS